MSLRAAAAVLSAGLPALPAALPRPSLPGAVAPGVAVPAAAQGLESTRVDLADISAAPPEGPRSAPRAAPAASAQLQAAQPPKPGPAAAERAFYDRVFGNARAEGEEPAAVQPPAGPSDPTLPALKADVQKLLEHLAATRTAWRGPRQVGEALLRRIGEVSAAGGIPRREPRGLFGSQAVVEPLDAGVLAQLPRLSACVRKVQRSERLDYSDLLRSFDVLSRRAGSREAFDRDIAWLYSTYHLGERSGP